MGSTSPSNQLTLIHFNDVYNIESRDQEPVGGAARFCTAVKQRTHLNPLVLFSGDAFNPSLMSTVTKGKQMVPVLNAIGVHCAVYGNHDFDFGIDVLVEMAEETTFPWLLANVYDDLSGELLAHGLPKHMIEWQGRKIGLIGLVEEEWIATLATVDPDEITFIDYVEEGRNLANELRQEGAEYIIALTHMRWPNDIRLAENVEEIDLILGGHDHDYGVKQINGKYILKSGTDFRNFSQVTLTFGADHQIDVDVQEVIVDSSFEEDPEVKAIVMKYLEGMGKQMENVLGYMDVELDGRFASIRTQETNLGNFVTDVILAATDADFALLNSGTLRSDMVHPSGKFRVKDLTSILPMVDPLVVIKLTGAQVLKGLENSVCKYPALEGRFSQVAGISFAFDPKRQPGSRVEGNLVKIQGEYLELEKDYTMCTKHYIAEGRDGFDVFKEGEVLVNDENGPRLTTIVQNHFKSVKIMKGESKPKLHHRQSLISVSRRKTLVKQLSLHEEDLRLLLLGSPSRTGTPSQYSASRASLSSTDCRRTLFKRRGSVQSVEVESMPNILAPKVEGRIICLDDQKQRELEEARMVAEVKKTTISEIEEPTSP